MLPDEFYATPQHKPGRKKSGVGGKARKSDGAGDGSGNGVVGCGHLACAGELLTVQWHAVAVNLPLADDLCSR